jgi:biopolymer transport protein ExbD
MDADESEKGFFKHVFNFDDDSKSEILNTLQYILLAIIPIVILNKTVKKFVPEADDNKSSLELSAEILIQVILTFIGLLLIHRFITYFPTYSKTKYPEFHIIFIVLAILMITMSLQTKLGEKVSILVERLSNLWNGEENKKKVTAQTKNGGAVTVKVTQPISGQQSIVNQPHFTEGTAISALPNYEQQQQFVQQSPNFNVMHRQDNVTQISNEGFGEPMAANDGFGAFASPW